MNTQEKIEAAGKKKEGNAWFKAGKYERASGRYEKVYLRAAGTCYIRDGVQFVMKTLTEC